MNYPVYFLRNLCSVLVLTQSSFFFSWNFLLCFAGFFFFCFIFEILFTDQHRENEHRKKNMVSFSLRSPSNRIAFLTRFTLKLMYMCVYTRIRFLKMLFSLFVLLHTQEEENERRTRRIIFFLFPTNFC